MPTDDRDARVPDRDRPRCARCNRSGAGVARVHEFASPVVVSNATDGTVTASAVCPDGESALSGGHAVTGATAADTTALTDRPAGRAWTVTLGVVGAGVRLRAFAVCGRTAA